MKKVEIEVQYFAGCPNSEELIRRVKKAAGRYGGNCTYRETLVDSPELAARIGFRGSPTLLINGVDFENADAPESPAMSCRIYPDDLPTEESILLKMEVAG